MACSTRSTAWIVSPSIGLFGPTRQIAVETGRCGAADEVDRNLLVRRRRDAGCRRHVEGLHVGHRAGIDIPTRLGAGSWNNLVLVYSGGSVSVYVNGKLDMQMSTNAATT